MYDFKNPFSLLTLFTAGAIIAFSQSAYSSAFALHEQNASGLGEFYAGASSVVDDASTNYYNPAGMVLLPGTQFAVSGVNIDTNLSFKGDTAYSAFTGYTYAASGKAGGGTSRFVPAVHITHQFNDKVAIGFSATSPFGLATSYSDTSIVRYQTVLSELKTINLGPSLAYRINEMFSVAAGFDAQYSEVDLSSAVNFGTGDVISKNTGSAWGWGWHAAALLMFDPVTRMGFNFRSEVTQNYEGTSKYDGISHNNNLSGTAHLPWMADISGYHAFNEKWSILGTIGYTNWSSIDKLELQNVDLAGTAVTNNDPLNYANSWIFLAGFRYQFNEMWMMKMGGGYDRTPTNDKDRDLRLPDANHWIVSSGIRLVPPAAKNVTLDLAYSHIFSEKADIDKNLAQPPTFPTNMAVGKVRGNADLIGAQISLRI